MQDENPFLDPSLNIRWSTLTAEHVEPDMEAALEQGAAALKAIESVPDGEETFENTFLALEEATETVSGPWGKVGTLDSLNDHPELRKAHRAMLPKVSAFFSAIPLNQTLYRKLKNFRQAQAFSALEEVETRFVEETLRDFEDAGANLDDPTRARLQEIESLLAEKTKAFSEHVLDSTNAFEKVVDSAGELAGLPDSLVEAARQNALSKGYGTEDSPKYRFTLHAPSFVPALQFLDSDELRRELYEAYSRIAHYGEYENEPLIREILTLRNEKARLLGRDVFPDWVLSRRMAKTGARALAFVEDLFQKTKPAFDREIDELAQFKAAKTGTPPSPLNQWEGAYWAEKLRREKFDFDEEELRPYFPLPSVMSGMFSLVEKIFGIRVVEQTDPKPETWHPDVRTYVVSDAKNGRHIGSFYADWFPRESKRSGAWMSGLLTGKLQADGSLSPHLGIIAGNMTPQLGDKPSLLTHREVETVFHEFGHLLHHVLSEVKIRSLSGTNVAWDFVELPSQIMENWCWERESLDMFARHHETGDPIPEDLFRKLSNTRTFGAARFQMRQLFFGRMDLALHLRFDPETDTDLDAFVESETEGYLPPVSVKFPSNIRSFEHLFAHSTGYASGYYSYKWAEVLDADAFTRFAQEGIMNPETGQEFRRKILAKGNSAQPEDLFRDFMGRDPDPMALLVRLGLTPSEGQGIHGSRGN
jgi:oligopeptidase A